MRILWWSLLLALTPAWAAGNLDFYFIDVEGGQATLIVSPSGESMLVDAGWPGYGGRDQTRIAAAAQRAGIRKIDYMLMTHYHLDHVGGIEPLVAKIPVGTFLDHGPNTETDRGAQELSQSYARVVSGGKHLVLRPGDRIPMKGLDIEVVTARGETISKALPGGGAANPRCSQVKPLEADPTENARSVGFVLKYGKFRFADLGDLTWNKELNLVCPSNRLGRVDIYLISHHGMDISNSPALIDALAPRVAILNSSARKGGSPQPFGILRKSPRFEDLWQLHYAQSAGSANSPEQFVANNASEKDCQGNWIQLSVRPDGGFSITNSRNHYSKSYQPVQ